MTWIDLVLVATAIGLLLVALALALAAEHAHLPHARLMCALCIGGIPALLVSLLIAALHLATGATPRFYHGMLTGLGLGILIAVPILFLADRYVRS